MILGLVDGDGYIFIKELTTQGMDGGQQSAKRLSDGVQKHLSNGGEADLPRRGQLWLSI